MIQKNIKKKCLNVKSCMEDDVRALLTNNLPSKHWLFKTVEGRTSRESYISYPNASAYRGFSQLKGNHPAV